MKNKLKKLGICLVLGGIIFSGCKSVDDIIDSSAEDFDNDVVEAFSVANKVNINIEDTIPVSRGLVAKMIAMTFNDKNAILTTDREIEFTDTNKDKWYDKYINMVSIEGYMQGSDAKFSPEEELTIEQAQFLINKLDLKNTQKIKMTEENKTKQISYALWAELYFEMLKNISGEEDYKDKFGFKEQNIIILATKNNNESLGDWNLITDKGPLNYEGLDVSYYIDKEIKVLIKDNEIVGILGIENEMPILKNTYVVSKTNEQITIFTGGVERTYKLDGKAFGDLANKICDFTIVNGTAKNLKIFEDQLTSTIKQVDNKKIELDGIGIKNFTEDIKIYSIADGEVKWKNFSHLSVGTDIAYYTMDDGDINAAIITKTSEPVNIRVALSTTGFAALEHESVSLTSDQPFNVKVGEEIREYKSGDVLNFSPTENPDLYGQHRLIVNTVSGDGKIAINNINRNNTLPKYRGTIEIAKGETGFIIVNEVDLEQYLYSVVPSEMPTKYGLEAAKVQAVTARSYAYVQYYANKFHAYGANVDDSVMCQVYNNTPETDISIQAVNQTKGLCITYNNKTISTNFFSTSSGYTANSGEVWADTVANLFPTDTPSYLKAKKQYSNADFGNLAKEENALKFFKETNIDSFDNASPWFRWNITMTAEELSSSINANLATRYNANPSLVKTLVEDGYYRSRPITSIGMVKNIEVVTRGEGGNVMQMKITGTENTIMIYTEYNIRFLMPPKVYSKGGKDVILVKKDGSQTANYNLLPSAFFAIEKSFANETLSTIKFYGGGNGHGVGMSQNGVKGMIDKGYTFDDIIKHYFDGVEIKVKINELAEN